MKYQVFLSDSIDVLHNEELICEGETYKEVCIALEQILNERQIPSEPYWRFIMNSTATFIDFGSWSKFAAIVPPISMSVLTGEDEEE